MRDINRVSKLLKEALDAVDASEVPSEIRPAAFTEAVRLLSGEPIQRAAPKPKPANGDDRTNDDSSDRLGAIAKKIGVSAETVAEVFHDDSGEIKLIIAASKLQSDKARATKQIALLIAAGRQGAGVDPGWTQSKVIRALVGDYGRLDSGNFATTLGQMGDVFAFDGKGQDRKIKVNRTGFEQAGTLVTQLTSGVKK